MANAGSPTLIVVMPIARAGFADVTFLPDAEEIAKSYSSFFVSAVAARRA